MSTISLLLASPPLSKPHLLFPSPSLKTLTLTRTLLKPLKNPTNPKPKPIFSSYNATPSTDRLISALSYTLPFVNSISYGRFLFARYPPLLHAVTPFFPLLQALHALPFAGFVAFFALYLGVVRNPAFSRFVRFNAMQAVVLDVLLAIPSLLQRVFGVPARGVGFKVMELGFDGIFLFAAGCFFYSLISCILGRTPYLPIVANAADRQL